MFEMLKESWFFLIPIIALSVYSLALIIHKIRWLKTNTLNSMQFQGLMEHLQQGQWKNAYEELDNQILEKTIMSRAISIIQKGRRIDLQADLMDKARSGLSPFAFDISSLSTLANMATLMGLLGTVMGMIGAFYQLKVTGESDPYILAGGISKALVTTAAGLIVAIPLMFSQNIFHRAARQKEEHLLQLISFFHHMYHEKRSL